jgi:hypothetical protein
MIRHWLPAKSFVPAAMVWTMVTNNNDAQAETREVVGIFTDREGFEAAVRALLVSGFARSDLSVLASHESLDAAAPPTRTWRDAITALIGEIKYEVPLVASGAIVLAGGAVAATVAGIIGAAVGGMAIKEILDGVTAKPHTDDFARSLDAGSVILWVEIPHGEKDTIAMRILEEHGAANVHTVRRGMSEKP